MAFRYRFLPIWLLGAISLPAAAQLDANVAVTVAPQPTPGQPPASLEGFLVCIGGVDDRTHYGLETTSVQGLASDRFIGLPSGVPRVITVQKSGYTGVERTETFSAGQNNYTIELSPGVGGPQCVVPPTPPPTRTLRVTVLNGTRAVRGAYVCVGTPARLTLYGSTRQTNASGVAVFTGLPALEPWGIVAGLNRTQGAGALPPPHQRDTSISIALTPGISLLCPGTPIPPIVDLRLDGRPIQPIAPDRLGEEELPERGHFFPDVQPVLDCREKGTNFVMIGLTGLQGEAIDKVRVVCAPLQSDGSLGDPVFTDFFGANNNASGFDRRCVQGRVVAGWQGTILRNQVRSIRLRCKTITPAGLVTGTSTLRARVGGNFGDAWGPDLCSGRPAKGIRVSPGFFNPGIPIIGLLAPTIVAGFQLLCEQPNMPP